MGFGTTQRDDSLRRVSSATRWLVGLSVGLVAVFSAYIALAIPSKKSTATAVSTPGAAAAPPVVAPTIPPTFAPSSGGSRTPLPTVAPPPQQVPIPMRPHTQSRGS